MCVDDTSSSVIIDEMKLILGEYRLGGEADEGTEIEKKPPRLSYAWNTIVSYPHCILYLESVDLRSACNDRSIDLGLLLGEVVRRRRWFAVLKKYPQSHAHDYSGNNDRSVRIIEWKYFIPSLWSRDDTR